MEKKEQKYTKELEEKIKSELITFIFEDKDKAFSKLRSS